MSSEFIPETQKTEVVPKELKDLFAATKGCAVALALFDQGYFSPTHMNEVKNTAAFLGSLFEQSLQEALKHPAYHMIPELKKAKEDRDAKELKN